MKVDCPGTSNMFTDNALACLARDSDGLWLCRLIFAHTSQNNTSAAKAPWQCGLI